MAERSSGPADVPSIGAVTAAFDTAAAHLYAAVRAKLGSDPERATHIGRVGHLLVCVEHERFVPCRTCMYETPATVPYSNDPDDIAKVSTAAGPLKVATSLHARAEVLDGSDAPGAAEDAALLRSAAKAIEELVAERDLVELRRRGDAFTRVVLLAERDRAADERDRMRAEISGLRAELAAGPLTAGT